MPFKFDASRWAMDDRITGGATVVLLLSLFAPWFHYLVGGGGLGLLAYAGSVDGLDAHFFLWLVFLIALAIIAYLVLQAGYAQLPFTLPASRERLLLAATGVNLLLVLLGFFIQSAPGYAVGYSFGAFLGLIAAIVAFAPQVWPYLRSRGGGQQ